MATTATAQAKPEVQKWLDHFAAYTRQFTKWEGRSAEIGKRYRDDRSDRTGPKQHKFCVLWSNVQTLQAATFSKLPQPDVSRRYRDNDPVARVASLIVERGLDYQIQHYPDYRATLKQDILDRFLGGRGQAWVRYEPHMRAQAQTPVNGLELTEDVDEPAAAEELDYECAPVDYVHWRDFGHTVARTWEEVTAVWRWVYLTRSACVERFGKEKGERIPLDATPEEIKRQYSAASSDGREDRRAKIAEIWDKETMEIHWLSTSLGEILDTRKPGSKDGDLTQFDEFFPCPRPLYSTLTNETLVPVPDYTLYQDQAELLNVLAERIDSNVKALMVQGTYDSSQKILARLFTEGESAGLLPVENWSAFSEKNGLRGSIDLVDIRPYADALKHCYLAFANVKSQIDELTGISDIIRGETDAGETATAQQIKSQYASLRLKQYQEEVALFATALLRLKAQVMCQKFTDDTLKKMAAVDQLSPEDQALVPQALELLRSDALRSFRVEIAADSLIFLDEKQEKQDRAEFLGAVAKFVSNIGEVAQTMDAQSRGVMIPLFMKMMKFGVTGFKVGRTLEGEIDKAADQMAGLAEKQAAQPPQPDPKLQAEQVKAQAEVQKAGLAVQTAQQEAQIEGQRMQMEQQHDQVELAIDGQRMQMDAAHQQQQHAQRMQQGAAQHQQRMQQAMQPPARPQ